MQLARISFQFNKENIWFNEVQLNSSIVDRDQMIFLRGWGYLFDFGGGGEIIRLNKEKLFKLLLVFYLFEGVGGIVHLVDEGMRGRGIVHLIDEGEGG